MAQGMYRLVGRLPVLCRDLHEWARWYEKADRFVAQTNVGPMRVSTVFLGLDHSFGGEHPILFETMVFDGGEDAYQERYETWDEAEKGHARAIAMAREVLARADASLKVTGSTPERDT
jgi:hypothetical protein